ncbi:molybdopterin-guanine dinucleotide biosynthesis protein B [Bacillus sp. H-16]|uniref:molybdopterin-guanine dinucleotide biosynthesis protein B n=1 Tax=Alteribacter salitolerans TaxID=2912333 RepID=UPI001965C4F9|nr:molybdopterin-guanine dinucleotide biosynthesis protein B [Alteribacter salitolerans]MBM7097881.1 molybdopterin-guanine dinucleotide biosynthesis protein B [Alteribacter salitolerans]
MMRIFQVTGYSGSGKTTLLTHWVRHLSDRGVKVSVIKHHGHGGALIRGDREKDSGRLREAGAASTVAISPGEFQWIGTEPPPLKEMIDLIARTGPDVILIEGYKREAYPKAVIVQNESDRGLVTKSTNVKAVICREKQDEDYFASGSFEALSTHPMEDTVKALTKILFGDDTDDLAAL